MMIRPEDMINDIPIKTINYISCNDIAKKFGKNPFNCYITFNEAENDSYCILFLDDYRLEEIKETIKYLKEHNSKHKHLLLWENKLELVEYLRSKGYKDSILAWVSW